MMARRWHMNRLRYVALLLLMGVVILHRTALMSIVLPTTWTDTDSTHLYYVLNDFQDFKLDSHPMERDAVWSRVQVNLSRFDIYLRERQRAYPEFWEHFKLLKSLPQNDEATRERTGLIATYQPIMTPEESAQLLFAFDTFVRACREAGLTFFILEASLMGVIRHHGLIPWDDDIDIVMNAKQWPKIRNVLGNIEGFSLYTPRDSQWKFYMNSAKSFPDKPFKFPNLDIFFYNEDETHIWAVTKGLKHDLVYEKSDIFPLQLRPFEHLMVPVPCNLDLVVHKAHDQNVCVTPEYIHKTNENFYFGGTKAINCKRLHDVYPFVYTVKSEVPGHVEEYLKVGARIIHHRTVPVGCNASNSLV